MEDLKHFEIKFLKRTISKISTNYIYHALDQRVLINDMIQRITLNTVVSDLEVGVNVKVFKEYVRMFNPKLKNTNEDVGAGQLYDMIKYFYAKYRDTETLIYYILNDMLEFELLGHYTMVKTLDTIKDIIFDLSDKDVNLMYEYAMVFNHFLMYVWVKDDELKILLDDSIRELSYYLDREA